MKGLYRLNVDCGRMGELEGVFIADKLDVEILLDESLSIYWGEVLGKHSEIYGSLEEGELIFITDDIKVIDLVEAYKLETGYNPFHYGCEDIPESVADKDCDYISEVVKELRLLDNN